MNPTVNYMTPVETEERGEGIFWKCLHQPNEWNLLPVARQLEPMVREPQRLDVLAVDGDGRPWIFEFKRSVADHEAIGQVLLYGGLVAAMTTDSLVRCVEEKYPDRRVLDSFVERFGKPMPIRSNHSVMLVLVAYAFSPQCLTVVKFLRHAVGIQIGLLTMKLRVPGALNRTLPEYHWECRPTPTGGSPAALPVRNLVVSLNRTERKSRWPEWMARRKVELDVLWVNEHAMIETGTGVWVGVQNEGWVGYGIIYRDASQTTGMEPGEDGETVQFSVAWQWLAPAGELVKLPDFCPTSVAVYELDQALQPELLRATVGIAQSEQVDRAPAPQINPAPSLAAPLRSGTRKWSVSRGSPEFIAERRKRAFALFELGNSPTAVAKELKVSIQSASRWAKLHASTAKNPAPTPARPGRQSAMGVTDQEILRQALKEPPPAMEGAGQSRWTAENLQHFIKEKFQIRYSRSHCYRLLRSLSRVRA